MDVFNLLAKIGLDTSEYDGGLKRIASGVGKATKLIGGAVAAGTAIVAKFGVDSVKAGMDFDSAMAQVAATSGKTMDELNSEINSVNIGTKEFTGTLRDFAQYMGSTTAFSATEAADALNYMALAGYDAETSMRMLPNVLNLAAAGGIELAAASDMVTDAQTALGLSLDETSMMVDQMAKASSKSNTSVAQLGEAFLTIGANARSLSGGTVELSTVLGVLADNGIKGAEAGTHLRNIMLSMNPTTDAAAAAWEQLGVEAYDTEGNMRPLQSIFEDLTAAMADMNTQQKDSMLSAMFNKTDLASVNAIMGTIEQMPGRFNELSSAIEDAAGASQAMADTQLDNLAGDITLFKSALEGAKIAISDKLTPTLREFVKFGSDGLSELTDAFNKGGLNSAMEVLGGLLSDAVNSIIEMLPSLVEAGMQLVTALVKGILDNADTIIDAAFRVIDILLSSLFEEGNVTKIVNTAYKIVLKLAQGIIDNLPMLIDTAVQIIQELVSSLTSPDNLKKLVYTALDLIVTLAEGLVEAIPQLVDACILLVENFVDFILDPENIMKLIDTSLKIVIALAKGIIQAIPKFIEAEIELVKKFITFFGKTDWKSVGKNIVTGILNGLKEAWHWLTDWVGNAIDNLIGGVKKFFGVETPTNSGLTFNVEQAPTSGGGASRGGAEMDAQMLSDAFKDALDGYEIKWDDRNLGRLVNEYA